MRFEPEAHWTDAAGLSSRVTNERPNFLGADCMATPSLLIHCYKGNLRVLGRIA